MHSQPCPCIHHLLTISYASSGVGWVEVLEELGTPVKQRRLLLVTPPTFALLEHPTCTLVSASECWRHAIV